MSIKCQYVKLNEYFIGSLLNIIILKPYFKILFSLLTTTVTYELKFLFPLIIL